MYPARSNLRSKDPGSAWFFVKLPGDTQQRVAISQWNTLVAKFQERAKVLLPERFYVDRGQSICSTLTQEQLIGKAGARTRASIAVTGKWDEITEEALYTLLCAAGAREAATLLFVDMHKPASGELSASTVRNLIWFATAVQGADYTKTPPFSQQDYAVGGSIQFPKDVVLPLKSTYEPAADARDAQWITSFHPGADAAPLPPSKQELMTASSAPSTANLVLGVAFLGLAGFAVYKAFSSDGSGARRNPTPRRNYARGASAEDEAAARYKDLHAGLEPDSIEYEKIDKPKYLVTLGEMPHIQYQKRLYEGGKVVHPDYKHPFAKHARPILAHDEKGRLHIVGGHYTTTDRGVEDLPPRRSSR